MSSPGSSTTNSKVIIERDRLFRWLAVTAALGAFLYLLLCTYLWNIVYGLFVVYVTDNAPNAKATASPWCEPGDWVLETFQPMISDKSMIEHLQKNKVEMTRVAEMAARKRDVDTAGNYVPASGFKELVSKLDLRSASRNSSWAERPYSIEEAQVSHACYTNIDIVLKPATREVRNQAWEDCRLKDEAVGRDLSIVSITPSFGKTFAQYFCSTARNSTKGYVYYPGGIPRIEGGRLMAKQSYSDRYRTFASFPDEALVSNTDLDPRGAKFVLRQIDERWFISRY